MNHVGNRVAAVDWAAVRADLDRYGCGLTGPLLTPQEAAGVAGLYGDHARFRSTINMARYRFGEGEYRYFFAEPLPELVAALRHSLYPELLPAARDWWQRLGRGTPWPDSLDEWLGMCHAAGQTKPTAILLRYAEGDWNALHRDLYGNLVFPLQMVINLSQPGVDHSGGEFLLYEQRLRAQSRATAVTIPHGHGLVFTTRDRPVRGARDWSAAPVRHGVSVIHSGRRFTLGLVSVALLTGAFFRVLSAEGLGDALVGGVGPAVDAVRVDREQDRDAVPDAPRYLSRGHPSVQPQRHCRVPQVAGASAKR